MRSNDIKLRRDLKKRVEQLQREKGYRTQEEMARAVEVDTRTVRRWLTDGSGFSLETLTKLAKKTETSLDWLLLGHQRRALVADDALAELLWQRVKEQAESEGASSEDAERVIPPPAELLEEVLDVYSGRGTCVAPLIIPRGTDKFTAAQLRSGRDLMASHVAVCDEHLAGIRMYKEQYRVVLRTDEKVRAGESLGPPTPAKPPAKGPRH